MVVKYVGMAGEHYPLPAQDQQDGYSSPATSSAGQSYISADGSNWSDWNQYDQYASNCIKAFTTAARRGADHYLVYPGQRRRRGRW